MLENGPASPASSLAYIHEEGQLSRIPVEFWELELFPPRLSRSMDYHRLHRILEIEADYMHLAFGEEPGRSSQQVL